MVALNLLIVTAFTLDLKSYRDLMNPQILTKINWMISYLIVAKVGCALSRCGAKGQCSMSQCPNT